MTIEIPDEADLIEILLSKAARTAYEDGKRMNFEATFQGVSYTFSLQQLGQHKTPDSAQFIIAGSEREVQELLRG